MIVASFTDVFVNAMPIPQGTKAALSELFGKILNRRSSTEVIYSGREDPASPTKQVPFWVNIHLSDILIPRHGYTKSIAIRFTLSVLKVGRDHLPFHSNLSKNFPS